MKNIASFLLFILLMSHQYLKGQDNYSGGYQYINPDDDEITIIRFCTDDTYRFSFNYKRNNNSKFEEIICYDGEQGFYETEDSVMNLISLSDRELMHQFRIIDTLNYEVLYSKTMFFKQGVIIHRLSSFAPNDTMCLTLAPSNWYILSFTDEKGKITYELEHLSWKNRIGDRDFYGQDSLVPLPNDIYKYKVR